MSTRKWLWSIAWLMLLAPVATRAEQAQECSQDDLAAIQQPRTAVPEPARTAASSPQDYARQLNDAGGAALEQGDLARAQTYYQKALAIRQTRAPRSLPVAESLNALGNVALSRGELTKANDYFDRALHIRARLAPGSRDFALSLISLGSLARRRGEVTRQEAYFQQAQKLSEVLTPVDLADILDGLGSACTQRHCSQKPQDFFDQALQLRQQVQPDSLGVADTLSFRGRYANIQGDLQGAVQDFTRALEIRRRLAPGSLAIAASLNDLGVVARTQGNLAEAEVCFRTGLQIRQRLVPYGLAVADSLHNLGILFWLREDLPAAREYLQQTLRIRRKLIPRSPNLAQSLIWQGIVSLRDADPAEAESDFTQALELLQREFSSDSLVVAPVLNNLGNVARLRGEPASSEDYYRRALAIQSKEAPGSPAEANSLQALAGLVRQHGKLAEAETYYRRALAIQDQKAPDSSGHVWALIALASLQRQQREREEAADTYAQAIDVLERETASLGGTPEDRAVFRAHFDNPYKDYVDLLIGLGRSDTALRVLERARARTLLEILDRARVSPHGRHSSDLDRIKHTLEEEIGTKSSVRIRLLDAGGSEGQLLTLDRQLTQLQDRYREAEEQIELQNPAYAALTHPNTLTGQQVQGLLDDDTLLLEYSLGQSTSYVWAATRSTLTVYRLPARAVIERAVSGLRDALIARARLMEETDTQRRRRLLLADAQYSPAARELSRIVLGPVNGLLTNKRIVIVSDGALQYVPFAALPAPTGHAGGASPDGEDIPLLMQHELVNLPSASVLAELRRQALERASPPKAVAVLADPVFDARDERIRHSGADDDVLSELAGDAAELMDRSTSTGPRRIAQHRASGNAPEILLDRLLWTRVEAAEIMKVTPTGAGLQALDFAANRAMALSPALSQYRIVHFATHAFSDSEHPERTGLVLSLFDQQGQPQNGFLGLEQIYGLNLPADLVVLSACETALGREIDGEGLVGLVRGFMYAGATRVMASLWSVDDEVTAYLMAHFYKSLEQDGLSPAAALRAAQMAVRKEGKWRPPYYWAGFQLEGEWR